MYLLCKEFNGRSDVFGEALQCAVTHGRKLAGRLYLLLAGRSLMPALRKTPPGWDLNSANERQVIG
jgi:hypothetical protein